MTRRMMFLGIFILAAGGLASCAKEEKAVFYIADHKDEAAAALRENSDRLFHNQLKGMEALGLTGQQERFYQARLDFFIAVLNEEKTKYKTFYKVQSDFYNLFPDRQQYYFYWSRDGIDFQILNRLKERFGEVALPADFSIDYFHSLVRAVDEPASGD